MVQKRSKAMKKFGWLLFILVVLVLGFSCANPANETASDETVSPSDLPVANATKPSSADDAKEIYVEASNLLYNKLDSEGKGFRGLTKAPSRGMQTINHSFNWSTENAKFEGTQTGTIDNNFPTTMDPGTYNDVMKSDIDFKVNGTMTNLELTDPDNTTKKYKVSGTIKHEMTLDISMSVVIGGTAPALTFTPSGNFNMSVDMESAYTIVRLSDGVGARFTLTYSDSNSTTISPETAGQEKNNGMGDPTCGYFEKTAKLTAYDDSGNILYKNDVPLSEIAWFMGSALGVGGGGAGGGAPGGGGGPGDGTDAPIALPETVASNPAYATYETEIFNRINGLRTAAAVTTFASTDPELDALARRYAQVGKVDTIPENLILRVKQVNNSCTDASSMIGRSTALDSTYVTTIMNGWNTSILKNADFTQIGIGMAEVVGESPPSGGTWKSAVVIFAKP